MTDFIYEDGLKLRHKVRAIIASSSGEVLLIRPHGYDAGHYTLAGGGVEAGESPLEAMRRELAEELGIECDSLEELPVCNRFVYSPQYKRKRRLDHDGQQAVMFMARIPRDTSLRIQTEEVADTRWFLPDEAMGAFPVAEQRTIFRQCIGLAA